MKKYAFAVLILLVVLGPLAAQSQFPIRGFAIGAPQPSGVDDFVKFIDQELAPRHVNTLILRVDYDYQYKTHPEVSDSIALSKRDVKKIVAVCKNDSIRIIPQINLLGHQSWAGKLGGLLRAHPEFDETPWVQMPDHYVWPNADNLYCKSYCPLAPGLHEVLFDLIDELCDAFEADAFHAGMDEVFYIGEQKCPRCGGLDPAVLFADEVRRIRDHLAEKNRELWIWGDRLLDGKTTGLGEWEASYKNTARAIDLIPKDVVICDWHYERADKTPVIFAMKGLRVVTCPWNRPDVASDQVDDMINFRKSATDVTRENYQGIVQTVWSSSDNFIKGFYANAKDEDGGDHTPWQCFRTVFDKINQDSGK